MAIIDNITSLYQNERLLSFGKVLLTDLHIYRQRCAAVVELSANEDWLVLRILMVEIKY